MQGLHEEIKSVQVYSPRTVTATLTDYNGTTEAGASGIDLSGFEELVAELSLGTIASGALDVALMHSDTDDGEAAAVFTDKSSVSAAFAQVAAASSDSTFIIRVRCKDMKRYLFVRVTNADAGSKVYGINLWLGKAKGVAVTQPETVNFDHSDA